MKTRPTCNTKNDRVYVKPSVLAAQFRPAPKPIAESEPVNLPPPFTRIGDTWQRQNIGMRFARSDRAYPGAIPYFNGRIQRLNTARKVVK
jgi:hypothetical protein